MLNSEVIRDLLKQQSQQPVFVQGKITIEGKDYYIRTSLQAVMKGQEESFNKEKPYTILRF